MGKPIITLFPRHLLRSCFACLWLAILATGCGADLVPGAPAIRDLIFEGQSPVDPRKFCFSIEWLDQQGDLTTATSGAEIRFSVENLDQPNAPAINTSPFNIGNTFITPGTTAGIIPGLCLDLREPTGNWPSRIKFSAQLVDSELRKSNKAWVIVKVKK